MQGYGKLDLPLFCGHPLRGIVLLLWLPLVGDCTDKGSFADLVAFLLSGSKHQVN